MFHSILPTSLKSRRAAQKSEMKSTDRWNKFQFEIRNTNNKSHISIEFSCESAYVHMLSPQSHCVRVMQTTVRIQRELGTECAHTDTQTEIRDDRVNVFGYVLICFSFDIERPQIFTILFGSHQRRYQNQIECHKWQTHLIQCEFCSRLVPEIR